MVKLPWWALPVVVLALFGAGVAGLRGAGVWRDRVRAVPAAEVPAPVLGEAPM